MVLAYLRVPVNRWTGKTRQKGD